MARIIAEAVRLKSEQADHTARGEAVIPPAAVIQRMVATVREPSAQRQRSIPNELVVRSAEGVVVARGQRAARGGGMTISIPSPTKHARAALLAAIDEILGNMGRNRREPHRDDR
jgi:hypothetical protein